LDGRKSKRLHCLDQDNLTLTLIIAFRQDVPASNYRPHDFCLSFLLRTGCHLPGTDGRSSAKIIVGSESASWTFGHVEDLVLNTKNILRSASFFVHDSETAVSVWKSVSSDFIVVPSVPIPFVFDAYDKDDPEVPLHSAIVHNQPLEEGIELFTCRQHYEGSAVNAKDSGGFTALALAAGRGRRDVVSFL